MVSYAVLLDRATFLNQITSDNTHLQSVSLSEQAAQARSEEGSLIFAPSAYSNIQVTSDGKLTTNRLVTYDSILSENYSAGLRAMTRFGLEAKLHYDIARITYINPVSGLPASLSQGMGLSSSAFINSTYNNAAPTLDLTQSIWGGGFGRTQKATEAQMRSGAKSAELNAGYQKRAILVDAEATYWRLSTARQLVKIQKEAESRAKKILSWSTRRADLGLEDQSDALQAEALAKSRTLERASSESEEHSAARAFNAARGISSDDVPEELEPLNDSMELPKKALHRIDVLAAEAQSLSIRASAQLNRERNLPTLEAFTSIALNGQQTGGLYGTIGASIQNSFSLVRPTIMGGIRFSLPLDFETTKNARRGWALEESAAERDIIRRQFDEEQSWLEITKKYADTKTHLELARTLETIQASKLAREQERLSHGRTTLFQVLQFEQDYSLAQLVRIQDESALVKALTQMKLFEDKDL